MGASIFTMSLLLIESPAECDGPGPKSSAAIQYCMHPVIILEFTLKQHILQYRRGPETERRSILRAYQLLMSATQI